MPNPSNVKPSYMVKALIEKGYSEMSANIITGQFMTYPDNRNAWGTEEQTRLDIEAILRGAK